MITICTWNLQHLSPPSRKEHREGTQALREQQQHNERNSIAIAALRYILKYTGVDILVLQEVNDLDDELVRDIQNAVFSLGYWFHWGPQMHTGSTQYTGEKQGKQSEFYPIIFRRSISCSPGELVVLPTTNVPPTHSMTLRTRRPSELTEERWVFHRPLVLYEISMKVNSSYMSGPVQFLLAVIHTSPGREDTTSPAAVNEVRQRAKKKKWIIAGDWYLQPDEKVSIKQGSMTWQEALTALSATRIAPADKTNYSANTGASGLGGSKVADYFVCHEDIGGQASVVKPPEKLQGRSSILMLHSTNPQAFGREWYDSKLSDHVPVFGALFW